MNNETKTFVEACVARLSDTCKCGHSIPDDHYHGDCDADNCDCTMPDMDEQAVLDAEMIAMAARIIRAQDAEIERLRVALEWFVDDAETTLAAGLLDEFNESQLRSKVQETRSWLAKS